MRITYSQFPAIFFQSQNKFLKFMIQQANPEIGMAIHLMYCTKTSSAVYQNTVHAAVKKVKHNCSLCHSLCCLSMPHSEFFSFLGRFFVIHRQGFTEVRVTGAEQEDRGINRRHRSLFEVAQGSLGTVCLQGLDIPIPGSCKQFQASFSSFQTVPEAFIMCNLIGIFIILQSFVV